MITVMESGTEPMKKTGEKCLDPQLWHAIAGGLVQIPPINSKVFYFPQGHAEHAKGDVDFGNTRIPAFILCKVSAIRYMADTEDEVFAKIRLVPLKSDDLDVDDDGYVLNNGTENAEKMTSFTKTLTQSDSNNGGGFSVPRYCAETIFPPLDYSAPMPFQFMNPKDVHGKSYTFRHIYRGTPRRHLLTTGWSDFVNHKKLVAGDSVVFVRLESGDIFIGIRRAKKCIGGAHEFPGRWNQQRGNYGSSQFWGVMGRISNKDSRGKVRAESVVEAANLAASGQPFEVEYYPRASTPEFCVRASAVRAAMQIRWCSGMRLKMPIETEDSSRISWFMGTISSVDVADPANWPDSPWGLLQVEWDEPDLLQNVKRVNPWLGELVTSMPPIPVSPFSPPRKKLRLPQNPDLSLLSQLPMPLLASNFLNSSVPFHYIQDNISAGIQGARHSRLGPYPADLHLNELQSSLFPMGFQQHYPISPPTNPGGNLNYTENNENFSHWLKMEHRVQNLKAKDETKPPQLILFGQVILTEEQLSKSSVENCTSNGNLEKTANPSDGSGSTVLQNGSRENSTDGVYKDHQSDLGLEIGPCKVFLKSADVGRTLDLSNPSVSF
ncbi:auxin response factor 18 [Morus notabilis]|uniref:auxin response factor 18 n=1 Tax=Morus notabilis TaxID=981085 RepID=UPI000CED2C51|nr:auxin response factor 18 [Morus notabilis]